MHPDSTGLHWVLQDSAGFCWAPLGSAGLCWALLGSSGVFWASPGTTGFHWAPLGSAGLCWVPLGSNFEQYSFMPEDECHTLVFTLFSLFISFPRRHVQLCCPGFSTFAMRGLRVLLDLLVLHCHGPPAAASPAPLRPSPCELKAQSCCPGV